MPPELHTSWDSTIQAFPSETRPNRASDRLFLISQDRSTGSSAPSKQLENVLMDNFVSAFNSAYSTEPLRDLLYTAFNIPNTRPGHQEDQSDKLERELALAFNVEPIEDGFTHSAEAILRDAIKTNHEGTLTWLINVMSRPSNTCFVASALKSLGRLEVPFSDQSRARIIREALQHEDIEVRDAAVQAVELWDGAECVAALRWHTETVPWLRQYLDEVIKSIRG